MKILLLEDEIMLQEAIIEYLLSYGYEIDAYEDGNELYMCVDDFTKYDIFVFDINTPSMDGLSLLQKLQENKIFAPTIFISAITQIEQISKAYELGCYDYLKKPFHLKELLLHIERLCKHTNQDDKDIIKITKMYTYDKQNKRLVFDNEEQKLTLRQIQILHLLATNIDKTIDFERLRYDIWDRLDIDNATIRAEVHRLKGILKEDIIESIKSVGYKLRRIK
jgi:two-component system, OmpR family, response regulator